MALQEQTAKLVSRLLQLSDQGKVSWQETADESTFLTSVGKFVVTIGKPSQNTCSLTITDQTGKILEESNEENQYPYQEYRQLANLHELARRRALNVDEALTEMLSSLEQIH
jgi:hypothetical protein